MEWPWRRGILSEEITMPFLGSDYQAVYPSISDKLETASFRTRLNAERADAMVATMADKPVCLLKGHGLTTVGRTVPEAVIRAINIDSLAQIQLRVMAAGAAAPDIDEDDLRDLPDLGSAFNDDNVWRFHLAALEHDNRLIR